MFCLTFFRFKMAKRIFFRFWVYLTFKVYLYSFISMAESHIDEYVKAKGTPAVEDTRGPAKSRGKKAKITENDEDIAAKRESLAILATLGTAKEFIGIDITLGNVKRMSQKDVEKYFVHYQAVLGQRITSGLGETVIETTTKAASNVLPIDDTNEISKELHNNDVVMRELSTLVGYLAVHGGRFVALATAIFIIDKHVKFGREETQVPDVSTEQKLE